MLEQAREDLETAVKKAEAAEADESAARDELETVRNRLQIAEQEAKHAKESIGIASGEQSEQAAAVSEL